MFEGLRQAIKAAPLPKAARYYGSAVCKLRNPSGIAQRVEVGGPFPY